MTVKVLARNRRAHFRYHILDTFDGGLVLTGPEIKSVRAGQVNLEESFGRADGGEIFLWNAHISPYKQGSLHVHQDPTRSRKVLLHKQEIKKILGKLATKGLTLIPLEIYIGGSGYAKIKLGLAKGKNTEDKRETVKRRDLDREMRRDFSGKFKS